MKTVLTTLVLFLALSFSFGQNIAIVKSANDFTTLKETGKMSIKLPETFTAEQVSNNSKYYGLYFTVAFDEISKVATINMTTNDERSRAIIVRFLAASEIKEVKVGEEMINRDLLYEKYLR